MCGLSAVLYGIRSPLVSRFRRSSKSAMLTQSDPAQRPPMPRAHRNSCTTTAPTLYPPLACKEPTWLPPPPMTPATPHPRRPPAPSRVAPCPLRRIPPPHHRRARLNPYLDTRQALQGATWIGTGNCPHSRAPPHWVSLPTTADYPRPAMSRPIVDLSPTIPRTHADRSLHPLLPPPTAQPGLLRPAVTLR